MLGVRGGVFWQWACGASPVLVIGVTLREPRFSGAWTSGSGRRHLQKRLGALVVLGCGFSAGRAVALVACWLT